MPDEKVEILPQKSVNQIYILILSNVFYFFSLNLVLFLDRGLDIIVQTLDFQSEFLLFIISLTQFYITIYGIIYEEAFRIYTHRYFSLFLLPYIILNFGLISIIENISIAIYSIVLVSIAFKLIETYYTYMYYYEILPYFNQKIHKRLGASEILNRAYAIRVKIYLFRDILIFRITYLLTSFLFFDLEDSIFILFGVVDLIVNIVAMWILLFHIDCENINMRYVLTVMLSLSLIKDLSILVGEFFIENSTTERKIIGTVQNILYIILYITLGYFNYKDRQLFGSGLKDYIKEGKRGLFEGNTRMKIK